MKCDRCGEENPADIHTCSPQREGMTRDEIIRMADEAKLIAVMEMFEDEVVRFAALVAAAEREACAVAAELVPAQWDYPVEIPHPAQACHDCAAAIRARGQE